MKRIILSLLVALLVLSQSAGIVAALTLESIGVTTVGRRISSWTYQGSNPSLVGTADPSAAVSIAINGTTQSATADGTGSWSYKPTDLSTSGSYPITISSGSDSMTFTLNLTTTASGSSTTTTKGGTTSGELVLPDELPQTGTAQETLLMVAGGLGLVMAGVLFYWKVVPKILFEESNTTKSEDDHFV
jgi:LPXTG-motif cell wall-anchored protein